MRGSCCIGCADQWLERRIRCDAQPRLDDGYDGYYDVILAKKLYVYVPVISN